MNFIAIIPSFRVPFLILAPICVLLGASISYTEHGFIDYSLLSIAVLGAIFSHIAVNTLNEYQDYTSGLDLKTIRTPFPVLSGPPSRAQSASASRRVRKLSSTEFQARIRRRIESPYIR